MIIVITGSDSEESGGGSGESSWDELTPEELRALEAEEAAAQII